MSKVKVRHQYGFTIPTLDGSIRYVQVYIWRPKHSLNVRSRGVPNNIELFRYDNIETFAMIYNTRLRTDTNTFGIPGSRYVYQGMFLALDHYTISTRRHPPGCIVWYVVTHCLTCLSSPPQKPVLVVSLKQQSSCAILLGITCFDRFCRASYSLRVWRAGGREGGGGHKTRRDALETIKPRVKQRVNMHERVPKEKKKKGNVCAFFSARKKRESLSYVAKFDENGWPVLLITILQDPSAREKWR